ncbi:protein NOI4-like [Phragmites australis]|uniref:protein NOI4-like n=1 Tax=Phragmites australis TaxID=29695 RepID=UPI002D799E9B|nr:protein NOI4-like [Phragmites australis]
MAAEKGSPLPKFGEWDVNDPASAEGFTVIFNKARDEKKTGSNLQGQDVPVKGEQQPSGQGVYATKADNSKKWFCCFQPSTADS